MLRTTLSAPDLADPGLQRRWRTLAAAAGAHVFLSWSWVACQAQERFADPLLIESHDGDALVGLALFNRKQRPCRTLYLNESGDPALDAIFTEHNGVLATPAWRGAVMAATLQAARTVASRVVLSGLDDDALLSVRAAGGVIGPLQTRAAPYAALDPDGPPYRMGLSRNTRGQLQRSIRAYQAAGPIVVERAATVEGALEWLACMLPLHIATWEARGIASGFSTEPVQRFHRALIARGVPGGEVDMLRITAGPRLIGYLLNLRSGGRVYAYQSGFDYPGAAAHEKPGLTCHHAAIEHARAAGAAEYDFLAGDARYKRSLGTGTRDLHWMTWQPAWSYQGLKALVRNRVRGAIRF